MHYLAKKTFLLGSIALLIAGCASNDPGEDPPPPIDKPAAAAIIDGEVSTPRQYIDKVEEANLRNADKARQGSWNYARPAVGQYE
ncbi:MAG: hypothetical protein LBV12_00235 [Puniceicoccales bacterium]|jgi:type IV pilus biogenesis protein CpaD/CtpE|nr:hypothetical protein [Puniceicoccales bacterium]